MTDSHANDDPAGVDTLLVDATATARGRTRTTTRTAPAGDHDSTVEPPADVAPELHEVTDA